MAEALTVVQVIEYNAAACRFLGSAFYGDLLDRMATDAAQGGAVASMLTGSDTTTLEPAVPLRLLGGLHRLVLAGDAPDLAVHFPSVGGDGDAGAAWPVVERLLGERADALRDALARPPQTNEVGRSVSLVAGFLEIVRTTGLPLQLLELGSSAGLNLRVDRYWYQFDGRGVGDPASPVRFVDQWQGAPPFDEELRIVERRGCDRDPIDAGSEDGRLTLLSYVWPDQHERLALLRAALEVARDLPVAVDRADVPAWLDEQLQHSIAGVATVVFHSIVWQYLSDRERADVVSTFAAAGERASASAPLAWLRLEPSPDPTRAELRLTSWPGGEERVLATSTFHVGPVDWLG